MQLVAVVDGSRIQTPTGVVDSQAMSHGPADRAKRIMSVVSGERGCEGRLEAGAVGRPGSHPLLLLPHGPLPGLTVAMAAALIETKKQEWLAASTEAEEERGAALPRPALQAAGGGSGERGTSPLTLCRPPHCCLPSMTGWVRRVRLAAANGVFGQAGLDNEEPDYIHGDCKQASNQNGLVGGVAGGRGGGERERAISPTAGGS